jgi:hypothetical protein
MEGSFKETKKEEKFCKENQRFSMKHEMFYKEKKFDIKSLPCKNISLSNNQHSLIFEWYVLDRVELNSKYYQKIVSIKDKNKEEIKKMEQSTRWDGGIGCSGIGSISDEYLNVIKDKYIISEI